MKYFKFIAIGVIVLFVGALMFAPDSSKNEADKPDVKGASTQQYDQIAKDIQNGALLVDVRTPEEFATEHAVGAVNVPLQDIQAGTYPSKDKNQALYLYCRSGKRANDAQAILAEAGYKKISVIGGLTDWKSMGGKATTTP